MGGPGKGSNSELGPQSMLSPAQGQVAPVREVLQKKMTLLLPPHGNSVRSFRHIPQNLKNVGRGHEFQGLHHNRTHETSPPPRAPIFPSARERPQRPPSPPPRRPPRTSTRPSARRGPRSAAHRELALFAARFRNTPGLMPSGELCNQGHRSRAKQTRLCVQRRPGERTRQGGARAGPQGRAGSLSDHSGRRPRESPRRGGPGPAQGLGRARSAELGPPHPPRPPPGCELGPKSRRTESPPAAWAN